MRLVFVLTVLLLTGGTDSVMAERFALKGKAVVCMEGEGTLDNIPVLVEDGSVRGSLFMFHEDAVEVFTGWEDGFVKSRVPVGYKETGRHYIWFEDAYVPVADRLSETIRSEVRKHTLNRFAWTGRYASRSSDGVSWVDSGKKLSCQVVTHSEAVQKVEEIQRRAGK